MAYSAPFSWYTGTEKCRRYVVNIHVYFILGNYFMVLKILNDTVRTLWMVRGCSFTLVFAGSKDLFYFVACISWFGHIPDDSAAASQEVESPRQLCCLSELYAALR